MYLPSDPAPAPGQPPPGYSPPYAPSAPGRAGAPPPSGYDPGGYRPPAQKSRKGLIVVAVVAAVALVAVAVAAFLALKDESPAKADFVVEADAVCRPANGPVSAIVAPTSYPEIETAAKTVVGTTNGQLVQLRALDHPSGLDGTRVGAVFASLQLTVAAAEALKTAAAAHDDGATITASKQVKAAFTDAVAQARDYGFQACGVGLATGIDALGSGAHAVVKAGFVVKAEALCRGLARSQEGIELDQLTSGSAFETLFVEPSVRVVADLKALPVPPGDEAQVAAMFEALDRLNEKSKDFVAAIDARDRARFDAVTRELAPLGTAADAKLDEYGLGVCGSNFGA